MGCDEKSVHAVVAALVRDRGISALGSAATLQSAIRHLSDGSLSTVLCDCPEASVLYRFSTDRMLSAFVKAAEERSCELLSEATLSAGATLAKCGEVTHLDACLAASEVAFGVSDALGMGWEDGARIGAWSDQGTSEEDDLELTSEQGEKSILGPSVTFLMVTYVFIRFVMAPLGVASNARPAAWDISPAGAFILSALLTASLEYVLMCIFRDQIAALEGTARKLVTASIVAIPLAMGAFAWWCTAIAGA